MGKGIIKKLSSFSDPNLAKQMANIIQGLSMFPFLGVLSADPDTTGWGAADICWWINNAGATSVFEYWNGSAIIIPAAGGPSPYTHPNHSGDVTSVGDGATVIAAGVIVNTDINANAAIVLSKLETISAETFVANPTAGLAVPAAVAVPVDTILGRITGGHVAPLSAATVRTLLSLGTAALANATFLAVQHPCGSSGVGGQILPYLNTNVNWVCDFQTILSNDPATIPVSLTVGGVPQVGDVVGFNWTGPTGADSNAFNFNVTYTVVGGDTTTTIAAGIVAALKVSAAFLTSIGPGYASMAFSSGAVLWWNQWWPMNTTSTITAITTAHTTTTLGAGGTLLELAPYHSLARSVPGRTPEVSDMIGGYLFIGDNTAGVTNTQYIDMICRIADPTAGAERGELFIVSCQQNGLCISEGMYTSGPLSGATGGYLGPGTFNAKGLYENGVHVLVPASVGGVLEMSLNPGRFAIQAITDWHLHGFKLVDASTIWQMSMSPTPHDLIFTHHNGASWNDLLTLTPAGYLGIGGTPTGRLHVFSAAAIATLYGDCYSDTLTHATNFYFRRSNNDTLLTNTATVDTQILGAFIWQGNSGAGFTNAGLMQCIQVGAASTYTPAALRFYTSDGATNWTEKFRIDPVGNIGIGVTVFDATGKGVLAIANNTAPAAHLDNAIQIYSTDSVDSTAALGIYTEQALEDIGVFVATKKFKICYNGVWLWVAGDEV